MTPKWLINNIKCIKWDLGFGVHITKDNKIFDKEYFQKESQGYFKNFKHLLLNGESNNEIINDNFSIGMNHLFEDIKYIGNKLNLQIKNRTLIFQKDATEKNGIIYRVKKNNHKEKNQNYLKIYQEMKNHNITTLVEDYGYQSIINAKISEDNNLINLLINESEFVIHKNNLNIIATRNRDFNASNIIIDSYDSKEVSSNDVNKNIIFILDEGVNDDDWLTFIKDINMMDFFHQSFNDLKTQDNCIIIDDTQYLEFFNKSKANDLWFGKNSTDLIIKKKDPNLDKFIVISFNKIKEFKPNILFPSPLKNSLETLKLNLNRLIYLYNWISIETNWSINDDSSGILGFDFLIVYQFKNIDNIEQFVSKPFKSSLMFLIGAKISLIKTNIYENWIGIMINYIIGEDYSKSRYNFNDSNIYKILDNEYKNIISPVENKISYDKILNKFHWYNHCYLYFINNFKKFNFLIIINPIQLCFGSTLNIYIGISYTIINNKYETLYLNEVSNVIDRYNKFYYNKIILEDHNTQNMNQSIYIN